LPGDRPACVAVATAADTTITFDALPDFAVPEPLVITAGTLTPSERREYRVEYQYPPQSPSFRRGTISVIGPDIDDLNVHVPITVDVEINDQQRYRMDVVDISFDAESPPIIVVFLDTIAGLITPSPLVIDPADPAASGGESLDHTGEEWVWVVRYAPAEPVALVCADVRDHNGQPALRNAFDVHFDVEQLHARVDDHPCRYLTVGDAHVLSMWTPIGFVQPAQVVIPENVLAAGTLQTFGMMLIPVSFVATVCVETSGAFGEITMNGSSVGWNAGAGNPTCVPINYRDLNVVTFGAMPGFRTPEPRTIAARTIAHWDTTTIVGTYSSP
jgi:hypothetical protein